MPPSTVLPMHFPPHPRCRRSSSTQMRTCMQCLSSATVRKTICPTHPSFIGPQRRRRRRARLLPLFRCLIGKSSVACLALLWASAVPSSFRVSSYPHSFCFPPPRHLALCIPCDIAVTPQPQSPLLTATCFPASALFLSLASRLTSVLARQYPPFVVHLALGFVGGASWASLLS